MKPAPEDGEWIRLRDGFASYAYLERIAICVLEGGLSEREAMKIALEEHQRGGASEYTPGPRSGQKG